MAGVVVEVRVQEGHEVKAGDPLLVLSAMKMESNVSAPVSGKVKRVCVVQGDRYAITSSYRLIVFIRLTLLFAFDTVSDKVISLSKSPTPKSRKKVFAFCWVMYLVC